MPIVPADPTKYGQPARTIEVPELRSAWAKVFHDAATSERRYVLSRLMHFVDDDGTLTEPDLRFVQVGANYTFDRGPYIIAVTPAGMAILDRVARTGIRFLTPSAPVPTGGTARVTGWNGLNWTYTLRPGGLELESDPIPSSLGTKNFVFQYQKVGAPDPAPGANGVLTFGNFVIPKPTVRGADGIIYQVGDWQSFPGVNRIGFTFNDAVLPATAYPYVIDPTTTITVAASSDDLDVLGISTSYPPTMNTVETTNFTSQKSLIGANYFVRCTFVEFNTSSLNGMTISSASLRLSANYLEVHDAVTLQGEYYSSSNWPIASGDGVITPGTGAFSGVTIGSLATGYNSIAITNPDANILKTGYTGFRFGFSAATPTDNNTAQWDSFDEPNKPQLVVVTPSPSSSPVPASRRFMMFLGR